MKVPNADKLGINSLKHVKNAKQSCFLKDLASVQITDEQFEKSISYLNCYRKVRVCQKKQEIIAQLGNYKDCNEFHVGGDLMVIYMKTKNDIIILRIGSCQHQPKSRENTKLICEKTPVKNRRFHHFNPLIIFAPTRPFLIAYNNCCKS